MKNDINRDIGQIMYDWAKDIFPINRSITGKGVRDTLEYLKNLFPDLDIHKVSSGTKVFDWTIPDEWNIRDAYILNDQGEKVIDFQKNNLHVVGYSEPVNKSLDLADLNKNLYSLPDQPNAIPYVTSYYKRSWGFCLSENKRKSLADGKYQVVIDSNLRPGVLNYGEIILPGLSKKEILISTYICHPSMANNEVSGPVVTIALARWLQNLTNRRYTYRIIFIPETIGSITYLSKHLKHMKEVTDAGFVVTCVGDDRAYSFMPSRSGDTLSDRVALHVLNKHVSTYNQYDFLERGSDERQYCSPLVDLPVSSIMRSKYGTYPEYHTSLDDLSFVSPKGLEGGFNIIKNCLLALEVNYKYRATNYCEPQLGKRGLYPTISTKESGEEVAAMMNLIAYADGDKDLIEISDIIGEDIFDCANIAKILEENGLLKKV